MVPLTIPEKENLMRLVTVDVIQEFAFCNVILKFAMEKGGAGFAVNICYTP